ncbi:MAG: TlpA disulfide reductase family protein [Acidimicrobiales bacterium]
MTDRVMPRRARGRLAVYVVVPLALVLALLVVVLATRDPASERLARSPLVGRPAPAIEGTTVEGERFDLDRYAGRWVVVNFFATWCTPCRQEHPELVRFEAEHEAVGDAAVVSVMFQDDAATVRRFFDERGGDWPVVEDGTGETVLSYGVVKLPESYIIGPDGVVQAKFSSQVTAAALDRIVL